jgi:hypothetical protein
MPQSASHSTGELAGAVSLALGFTVRLTRFCKQLRTFLLGLSHTRLQHRRNNPQSLSAFTKQNLKLTQDEAGEGSKDGVSGEHLLIIVRFAAIAVHLPRDLFKHSEGSRMRCGSRSALRVLCVMLLLATGCVSLEQSFGSRARPTFLDTFRPDDLLAKYQPQMKPWSSYGTGTGARGVEGMDRTKHFEFCGIQLSELEMIATLNAIQKEMIERASASGVQILGAVRHTTENGVLHRFEFDYRHNGVNGLVRGQLKKCEKEPGWDLLCVVAEKIRD